MKIDNRMVIYKIVNVNSEVKCPAFTSRKAAERWLDLAYEIGYPDFRPTYSIEEIELFDGFDLKFWKDWALGEQE